jgi:hypothetical protein
METINPESQEAVNQLYNYAATLLVQQNKSAYETKAALIEKGLSIENAEFIVDTLEDQIQEAKNERARKDMLYGALWCIGGTALKLANVGFIFWGAILFGGIQFFKGLINVNS